VDQAIGHVDRLIDMWIRRSDTSDRLIDASIRQIRPGDRLIHMSIRQIDVSISQSDASIG
jgi:hypothetical protein